MTSGPLFPQDLEMWAGLCVTQQLDYFVGAVQEIGFDIPVSELQLSVVTTPPQLSIC